MSIAMLMILLACVTARPDTSDTDSMSDSDSSSTRDMDMDLDNNDPNLHNPQRGQGYGPGYGSSRTDLKSTSPPPVTKTTLKAASSPKSLGEQTIRALLQFGIVVGVCLMVGLGFMTMVWVEILCDKFVDEYRRLIKKPKPLPDIERLHPAELVGKFSRYK